VTRAFPPWAPRPRIPTRPGPDRPGLGTGGPGPIRLVGNPHRPSACEGAMQAAAAVEGAPGSGVPAARPGRPSRGPARVAASTASMDSGTPETRGQGQGPGGLCWRVPAGGCPGAPEGRPRGCPAPSVEPMGSGDVRCAGGWLGAQSQGEGGVGQGRGRRTHRRGLQRRKRQRHEEGGTEGEEEESEEELRGGWGGEEGGRGSERGRRRGEGEKGGGEAAVEDGREWAPILTGTPGR